MLLLQAERINAIRPDSILSKSDVPAENTGSGHPTGRGLRLQDQELCQLRNNSAVCSDGRITAFFEQEETKKTEYVKTDYLLSVVSVSSC